MRGRDEIPQWAKKLTEEVTEAYVNTDMSVDGAIFVAVFNAGKLFPRYRNPEAASFAAENRSAQGGAETGLLAQTWPARNF